MVEAALAPLHVKGGSPCEYPHTQLKSMVKWYKRDGDIKLPNRKKRTDY
jgi:hypothetical protein